MKYKNRYAVKLMCKVLKISESGYYRWLKNKDKPSKRHLLLVKINEILSEHPDNANYGYDRIHKALEIRGESFFATLKKEKLYQIPTYRMKKEEVKTIVFRYIFIYYNRIRLYTGNPGYLPPSEYRIRDREKTAA